jgi:hypothetical protein
MDGIAIAASLIEDDIISLPTTVATAISWREWGTLTASSAMAPWARDRFTRP